jgi:hypothetical protein
MYDPFEIARRPTTVNDLHESMFRASGIIDYVKHLLAHKVPTEVILDLLAAIENQPGREMEWGPGDGPVFVDELEAKTKWLQRENS